VAKAVLERFAGERESDCHCVAFGDGFDRVGRFLENYVAQGQCQVLQADAPRQLSILNSKERTVGLGPGIQLGGRGLWFRANGYVEMAVRDRPSGIKVTFRISKAVAAEKVQP
jgi:hypothetical protein